MRGKNVRAFFQTLRFPRYSAPLIVNALSDLVIFRARDPDISDVIGRVFAGLDVILGICLLRLDVFAALVLIPYLLYRVYAVWWGRALAELNR